MPIREHVDGRARLTVEQVEPGDLSPGEFSYRIRDAVEERGVRLVVIDSLNGYLTRSRRAIRRWSGCTSCSRTWRSAASRRS